ncbi:MAG: phosphatidylglycerol lysyltransferase domain-containing protein [Oscillospiraceae bacterium]|nr:phosphatidylglycerol lysyltransferase domain-containing protein [Oscillospiraceae bacterium]
MLEFKTIALNDKEWIKAALKSSDFRGCEYSFSNNMAWRRLYDTQICRYKGFYISCSHKHGAQFIFPAGEGDYRDVFNQMAKYSEKNNVPFTVNSVTNGNLPIFEELYPGRYTVTQDEGGFDYIYGAEDLRTLSGKKYHGKRNHLNRFNHNHWQYNALTEKDFDDCIEFAVKNYNLNGGYDDESSVSEQFAINTFFNHFEALELKGGIVRVDGEIQGFTIGEGLNSDTFVIHIEKANPLLQGSYAAINHEFAKAETAGYTYINREEDLGLEGLRKAKRSYYPRFLLEKNTVTINL